MLLMRKLGKLFRIMNLKEDIKPYLDQWGFVQPALGANSFNGVLYTAEYILALYKQNILTMNDISNCINTINKVIIEPGLIKRTPSYNEQEGPDDYIGFLCVAKLFSSNYAKDFLKYGLKHWGSYNNEQPGKWTTRSFLWRQPQLIAHALYACGERPIAPLRFIWAITILLAGWRIPTNDLDARILSYLLIQNWDGKGWFCKWVVRVWNKRLLKDYPNGMKDVMMNYFQPGHPLGEITWD